MSDKKMDVDAETKKDAEVADKKENGEAEQKEEKKEKKPRGRKGQSKSADKSIAEQESSAKVEGKRNRKKAEAFTPEISSAPKRGVDVPEGKGTPLGECVPEGFEKSKSDSEWVQLLHRVCFNRAGTAHNRKATLKKFKGWVDFDEKAKEKKVTSLAKYAKEEVHKVAAFLNLEVGGDKNELVERVVDFLSKPHKVDKDYKFSASGKKRKSTSSKSKKEGSGRVNPYMLFSTEKRKELKTQKKYADMKVTEIAKVIGALWRELDESEKEEWKEKAAKAKPSEKKEKKKSTKSKAKTKKEKKADETESDEEEEGEEEEEEEEQPKKKKAKTTDKKEAKKEAANKKDKKEAANKKEEENEETKQLKSALQEVLKGADFDKVTMKEVKKKLKEEKNISEEVIKAKSNLIKKLVEVEAEKQAKKDDDE